MAHYVIVLCMARVCAMFGYSIVNDVICSFRWRSFVSINFESLLDRHIYVCTVGDIGAIHVTNNNETHTP